MPVQDSVPASVRAVTLKCLDKLPSLSPATSQLLGRLARPNCSVADLTRLVERDPVLCGQILRLANSATFGRTRQINSVKHAIAMVGVGTMRKFTLASSLSNLFARFRKPSGFSIARFNLHAVAVATLSELLAAELPVTGSQSAFVAGLLHDMGKMLIAVSMPREFETILSFAAVTGLPLYECERKILETTHAELSGLTAGRWDLGDQIFWATTFHHEPERAIDFERPAAGEVGLSLLVNKADAFINYLGMGMLATPAKTPEVPSLEFPGIVYSPERVLKQFELQLKVFGEAFH